MARLPNCRTFEAAKGLTQVGGPDATRINAAHEAKSARAREERVPEFSIAAIGRVTREFSLIASDFQSTVDTHLDQSVRTGTNGHVFQDIGEELRAFTQHLREALATVVSAAQAAELHLRRHQGALAGLHALQEGDYRALIAASEEQGGRAAERAALQGVYAAALASAKELEARVKHRNGLRLARATLLKVLRTS